MNFSEESLTNYWQAVIREFRFTPRECQSCGITKPDINFHGADKICNLCRKLLRLDIKYSHKIKFCRETLLEHIDNETICCTCHLTTALHDIASYSYECVVCSAIRGYVELSKSIELEFWLKCRRCKQPKPVATFPMGRLTCRSCICDMNAHD